MLIHTQAWTQVFVVCVDIAVALDDTTETSSRCCSGFNGAKQFLLFERHFSSFKANLHPLVVICDIDSGSEKTCGGHPRVEKCLTLC